MNVSRLFKMDGFEAPISAFEEFYNAVLSEGREKVLSERKFQKIREKWVAAATCFGMTDLTKKPWFLKILYDDPPDFLAAAHAGKKGNIHEVNLAEIEIMECTRYNISPDCNNAEEKFFNHVVDKKIKSKAYFENTILVIHSRFTYKNFQLDKVANMFKKLNPKLGQIWDFVCYSEEDNLYLFSELYPGHNEVKIDMNSVINELRKRGKLKPKTI